MLAVAFVGLSSCSDDNNGDDDLVYKHVFSGFFVNMEDLSASGTAVYTNVGYQALVNYTRSTAEIDITGLRLPDGTQYPTMTLSGLKLSIDSKGRKVITGSQVVPQMSGYAAVPVISSIEFVIYDRIINDEGQQMYSPGVCARYTIDSRYRVISSYSPQTLFGESESESTDGSVYKNKDAVYVVTYNTDTRLLNIRINNARFAQSMPMALNIDLPSIPVVFRGTSAEFDVDAITPYMNGVPFDSFPITRLKGSIDFASGLEFSFHCVPSVMHGEEYDVEVECSYSDLPEDM